MGLNIIKKTIAASFLSFIISTDRQNKLCCLWIFRKFSAPMVKSRNRSVVVHYISSQSEKYAALFNNLQNLRWIFFNKCVKSKAPSSFYSYKPRKLESEIPNISFIKVRTPRFFMSMLAADARTETFRFKPPLWAAGTQHRCWWRRPCRWTQHYKQCLSSFVFPASSWSPPDFSAQSRTRPLSLVSDWAADRPVFLFAVWSPAAPSPLAAGLRPCRGLAPAAPAAAAGTPGGTPGGTGSSGCRGGGLLRQTEINQVKAGSTHRPPVKTPASEWVWDCRWERQARPAGSDGFQPGPSGPPGGSLDLSGPPAADSSAPAETQ